MIPTADEILNQYPSKKNPFIGENKPVMLVEDAKKACVEFAQLHVKAALKNASENGECKHFFNGRYVINKQSILTSYPKKLIK